MPLTLSGVTISGGVTFTDEAAPPAAAYKLFTWGQNKQGSLGINVSGDYFGVSSPTQVGTGTDWAILGLSENDSTKSVMAVKTDGTLWGWGASGADLGLNVGSSYTSRSSPTQVGTGTNWSTISSHNPGLAVKTDGTLWSWGNNFNGQNGLNNRTDVSSPTQVGSGTNWSKVEKTARFSFAIKTDGTLWSCGQNNNYGPLGQNDRVSRSSPTQVGTGTNWSMVSSTDYSAMAIKTDGTLSGWGRNDYGQLGQNDVVDRSSPTQVGSATNWSSVNFNYWGTIAVKTDGTLWSWGYNGDGQRGTNDNVDRSSPVQVGTGTNWAKAATAIQNSIAYKTDGTLWAWGSEMNGVVGNNQSPEGGSKSSPIQIGSGTSWNNVAISGYLAAATRST